MDKFIQWLDVYFGQKAPALPIKAKEVIVKIAPWLSAIMLLVALPILFAGFGMNAYFSAVIPGYASGFTISLIFTLAVVVLNGLAIPGLFKRSLSGWNFSFYAALAAALQNLFMNNIVGMIINLAINFYILFQIRSYYSTSGSVTPPPAAPMQ